MKKRAWIWILALLIAGCSDDGDSKKDAGTGDATVKDQGGKDPTQITLRTAPLAKFDYHVHVGGKGLILVDVKLTPGDARATISAKSTPAMPIQVLPADQVQGRGVHEVMLTPEAAHAGTTVPVEVTVAGGSQSASETIKLVVQDSGYQPPAAPDKERDLFIKFIKATHPELKIDESTAWEHWINVAGAMVVTNHLYLSKEWELNLAVHVTHAPDDWVKAYLRRRSELKPSWAATLKSRSTDPTITEDTPPDSVTR